MRDKIKADDVEDPTDFAQFVEQLDPQNIRSEGSRVVIELTGRADPDDYNTERVYTLDCASKRVSRRGDQVALYDNEADDYVYRE